MEDEDDPLAAKIATADAQRRRANAEGRPSLWSQVARVGTLGWLIAVPTVAGAALGRLLDHALDSGVTWALALMTVGLASGIYALWLQLRRND